ncbi:hypothetical protein DPMN_135038 [Dreissena polymorpha]|uniref:Uncharacterized protein n=2 Tax=Dreissena polymorpha TaxID=45954 RepID=A0A9D4G060_DREPO|nr:hypothetical protein DPMN_135038 [Dreissena polymorpha]
MQYEEYIVGLGWISRPCPAGLLYVQDDCECTKVVAVSKPSACTPEIYLPFNNSHYDQSGKNNYILNENVVVDNGKAVFNGYNSQLVIPRFTNVDPSTIVVKVLYTSDHEMLTQPQTILSNGNCGQGSSIGIAESYGSVIFTVGTITTNTISSATVPVYQTASHEKDIVLSFNQGVLKGKLGNNEKVMDHLSRHLHSARCALHIGNSGNVNGGWFKGAIEELSIYLCA